MKYKKKMPKHSGITFVIIGAVLMMSALLLFFCNIYEEYRAGRESELLLNELQTAMSEEADKSVIMIDGYEYIGIISIPDLELTLPIMADWDYNRLKYAPCRHFGSSDTDDLVIAAHNYKTHFGRLSELTIGAEVIFTDMNGSEIHYTVQKLITLSPDDVEAVQDSSFDLVLYTCTVSGSARTAAFCTRVQ